MVYGEGCGVEEHLGGSVIFLPATLISVVVSNPLMLNTPVTPPQVQRTLVYSVISYFLTSVSRTNP